MPEIATLERLNVYALYSQEPEFYFQYCFNHSSKGFPCLKVNFLCMLNYRFGHSNHLVKHFVGLLEILVVLFAEDEL